MSEDKTQDITKKYDTKPTIETVLERIIAFEQAINTRFDAFEQRVNARFDNVGEQLGAGREQMGNMDERISNMEEWLGIRLDRIESEVKMTHSEMFTLRADFGELKIALKDYLPTT